jgi:hypothetical protein
MSKSLLLLAFWAFAPRFLSFSHRLTAGVQQFVEISGMHRGSVGLACRALSFASARLAEASSKDI